MAGESPRLPQYDAQLMHTRPISGSLCVQAVQGADDACLHEAVFAALVSLGASAELLQLSCPGLEAFLRRTAGLPSSPADSAAGVEPMDAGKVCLAPCMTCVSAQSCPIRALKPS